MKGFLWTVAAIGVASWGAEYVLDKWVIRSDSADPSGIITQAEGFGIDDVVRLLGVGLAGAAALKFVKK